MCQQLYFALVGVEPVLDGWFVGPELVRGDMCPFYLLPFSVAFAGDDFNGTPLELVVLVTSTPGTVVMDSFTVDISSDSILEFTEEFDIDFDMTDPVPGVMFGTPSSVTVSILDDGEEARINNAGIF